MHINVSLCFCVVRACVCRMLPKWSDLYGCFMDSLLASCDTFGCTYNGTGICVHARVSSVGGSLITGDVN